MQSGLKNLKRLFAAAVTSDALSFLSPEKGLYHTKSSKQSPPIVLKPLTLPHNMSYFAVQTK